VDEDLMLQDSRSLLYGIHKATTNRVVVVEGPADVWRIGPGAVATLGISWKVPQACILRQFRYRYILFDPETKAQSKARELADWLAGFSGHTEIIDGLETDPGAMPRKDIAIIRKTLLKQKET
jgi:hypothetical protein